MTTENKTEKTPVQLLDAEQTAQLMQTVDTKLGEIRTEFGTNVIAALKAVDSYSRTFQGDANTANRVAILSSILALDTADMMASKCGQTALSNALGGHYTGQTPEQIRENVVVTKATKEKEDTPDETETGLVEMFKNNDILKASKAVRALTVEDSQLVVSVSAAALTATYSRLGTAEHPFKSAAADFVTQLVGYDGGTGNPIQISDKELADARNVDTKTIQRGRKELVAWMTATGKGIVDISAAASGKTIYKVNLLKSVTRIMHDLLNSGNVSTDRLLRIASASGTLLEEGTTGSARLQKEIGDKDFAEAKALAEQLATVIDDQPAPTIVEAPNAIAARRKQVLARLEKFGSTLSKMSEGADALNVEGMTGKTGTIATVRKELQGLVDAFTADETADTLDTTDFETKVNAIVTAVTAASDAQIDAARQDAAELKEAKPDQTPLEYASEVIGMLAIPAHVEEKRVEAMETFDEAAAFLLVIADKQGNRKDVFLDLSNRLQVLFGFGKGKVATEGETPSEGQETSATA